MTAEVRLASKRHAPASRGQGLVEFTLVVPVMLVMLMGMVEFGFVFTHNLTLEYATREGARTGSALGNGDGDVLTCNGDGSAARPGIDAQIVAAIERVLNSPGSPIKVSNVSTIQLWKATATGTPASPGETSTWTYSAGGGPNVDGVRLDFRQTTASTWTPCTRNNGATPDSIGVSLTYTYNMVTPISSLLRFFGGPGAASLQMSDRTVMALNP